MTDVPAAFVADPFMLRENGVWHMFFEVMNERRGKGEIGMATSEDGVRWQYHQIVLRESFHLSYPYVFTWGAEYFMVPETEEKRAVHLYRARSFPAGWARVATLLTGHSFKDPSLLHYEGRWWMFVEADDHYRCGDLRLCHAADLFGPWVEHPMSPIVTGNPLTARPAGRIVVHDGRIIRYAQQCQPVYGLRVRAFEITELTPERYDEREVSGSPVLSGADAPWNACGMHHVDAHELEDGRWLACVDGWIWNPLYRQPAGDSLGPNGYSDRGDGRTA
ncbi:MAG: hypothetical protein QN152_12740 [Armatimonadota bacterium]|nr:hypothetical protein [Armatimonadota bacterium]MDR7540372.1 hypothetical protein [Armatimonadota bacterium]